jgi:hypothetical protein
MTATRMAFHVLRGPRTCRHDGGTWTGHGGQGAGDLNHAVRGQHVNRESASGAELLTAVVGENRCLGATDRGSAHR